MPYVIELSPEVAEVSYVVTLIGYLPPPRTDGVPWTRASIFEAPAPTGPFVQIDQQTLEPVDADPRLPQARDITTALAQLALGWYQVQFLDAGGAVSQPSDPERQGGDGTFPPSPDDIRNESPLLRGMFPLPPADAYQVSDLRRMVYEAIASVQAVTWRLIDPTLGDPSPEGYTGEALPSALEPVAMLAIGRLVERYAVVQQPGLAQQFATGRQLSGFNAGGYSESYFAPGEFLRRGVVSRPSMDSDPTINDALWSLATEDAKDYFVWRNEGLSPPVGVTTSFDYRRQTLGYGAGESALPGGFGRGGPDGF